MPRKIFNSLGKEVLQFERSELHKENRDKRKFRAFPYIE